MNKLQKEIQTAEIINRARNNSQQENISLSADIKQVANYIFKKEKK